MKSFLPSLALAAAAAVCTAASAGDLAFVDVHVLTMDGDRVLAHQTVLTHDDQIVAIGPLASTPVPAGATVVKGEGGYLLPGLADMHVHVADEDDLGLYVANGVTTVLHMGNTEQRMLGWIRDDIRQGAVLGPQMLFSLMVDAPHGAGTPVGTPAQAVTAASFARNSGYDYIKVYNGLSPEVFAALVDAGRAQGLPVIGHGVRAVGLPAGLEQGQVMVAHMEEFMYTGVDKDADQPTMDALAARVRRAGAYVTATLSTYATIAAQWGRPEQVVRYLNAPEARYVSLHARTRWNRSYYVRKQGDIGDLMAPQQRLTLAFQRAGVPLLAGTDSPEIPGQYPGFSLIEELRALHTAGLSNVEALSAATRNAGDFVHATHPERQRFGRVKPGWRADLVLVGDDPLASLDALRRPRGVLAGGRWFDRTALDGLLEERRRRYDRLDEVK